MVNFGYLLNAPLFQGISEREIGNLLSCLGSAERVFERDEVIFRAGESASKMGIVLTGGVNIVRVDAWGNVHILDHVGPGQAFAETYACVPDEMLMVDVVAADPTRVLFLDIARTLEPCENACAFHARLIRNLLSVIAMKNMMLTRKMTHITPKSIRERLLSYLSYQSVRHASFKFEIPFNRQQLADYLSVERSALSNELSKMRRDGLIEFRKSHFTLLTDRHAD